MSYDFSELLTYFIILIYFINMNCYGNKIDLTHLTFYGLISKIGTIYN